MAGFAGIGDARAPAIVKGRPYKAPEELVKKGILTQAVFARRQPRACGLGGEQKQHVTGEVAVGPESPLESLGRGGGEAG